MPVDKLGRMSDTKTGMTVCHSLILIIIIFVVMVALPFPVLLT